MKCAVSVFNSELDRCQYVLNHSVCQGDGLIKYSKLVYCEFSPSLLPVAIFVCSILLLLCFVGLSLAADDFFCPSLAVIVDHLKISHNIAGVTFVALGNGAPDIFSAIAAVTGDNVQNPGLLFGALFGAGIFVSTVIVGLMTLIQPFTLMKRPFLRDTIFYIFTVFWAFMLIRKGSVAWYDALGFIGLYVIYVGVVVVGRCIRLRVLNEPSTTAVRKARKDPDDEPDGDDEISSGSSLNSMSTDDGRQATLNRTDSILEEANWHYDPRIGVAASANDDLANDDELEGSNVFEETASEEDYNVLIPATSIWKRYVLLVWFAIRPVSIYGWKRMRWYGKLWLVLKTPVQTFLTLTIPKVDLEAPLANWNKALTMLHCLFCPIFAAYVNKGLTVYIYGVIPVYVLLVIVGSSFAVLVAMTTKWNVPPKFHKLLAYAGFVMAVIWIYSLANEVVSIINMIGIVFKISSVLLGLTLLAWSNSLGDLIVDLSVARQGYPRMGVSACFGGPLLNLLMGVGISFLIVTVKTGHDFKLEITSLQTILWLFLTLALAFSMLVVTFSGFRASRAYAVCLLVLYAVFLVVAILSETGNLGEFTF